MSKMPPEDWGSPPKPEEPETTVRLPELDEDPLLVATPQVIDDPLAGVVSPSEARRAAEEELVDDVLGEEDDDEKDDATRDDPGASIRPPKSWQYAEAVEHAKRVIAGEAGVLSAFDTATREQIVKLARKGAEVDIDLKHQQYMAVRTNKLLKKSLKLLKRHCQDKEMLTWLEEGWALQLSLAKSVNDISKCQSDIMDAIMGIQEGGDE